MLAPATGPRAHACRSRPGSVILPGEEIARIAGGGYYPAAVLAGAARGGDRRRRHGARRRARPRARRRARRRKPGRARSSRSIPRSTTAASSPMSRSTDSASYFVGERTLVSIPGRQAHRRSPVPPQAVTTRHGVDYVRIAGAQGEMDVAVILGEAIETADGPRVEILTGLRDGDRVVTAMNARHRRRPDARLHRLAADAALPARVARARPGRAASRCRARKSRRSPCRWSTSMSAPTA